MHVYYTIETPRSGPKSLGKNQRSVWISGEASSIFDEKAGISLNATWRCETWVPSIWIGRKSIGKKVR